MPLPTLKTPTLLTNKDGFRELVWLLPKEYAQRAADLISQEAKISVKVNEIDHEESFLSTKYPEHKSSFVTFAILLFRSFYNKCNKAQAMLDAGKVKVYYDD